MKTFNLLFTAFVLFGCKNSDQQTESLKSDKITKNCLTQLDLGYEQLLSLNKVSALLSLGETEFKTKSTDRKDQYGDCYYFWPSDRPDVQSPVSVHVYLPDENFVGISGLNAYDENLSAQDIKESFEIGYKQLSKDELAKIEKNMEKHLENKSDEEKKAVEGFIGVRKNFTFEKVENMGQSAFWRFSTKNGGELVTLYGNEKFTIFTKISHDAGENLELAKKLAQTIMDKCP